jgi:hypothetical protein
MSSLYLFQLGANIGVRNSFGETALNRILPETLEQFLDSCTTHENHPLHKDFKVGINTERFILGFQICLRFWRQCALSWLGKDSPGGRRIPLVGQEPWGLMFFN